MYPIFSLQNDAKTLVLLLSFIQWRDGPFVSSMTLTIGNFSFLMMFTELDINENVRAMIKRVLLKEHPTTIDGVKIAIYRQIWSKITSLHLCTLYDSFPKSMATVIKSKGGPTKY